MSWRVATVVLVVGYAWWAVSLAPFSSSATIAVLLAGGTAAVIGAAQRRRPTAPAGRTKAVAGWGVLVTAAGVWQLAAFLQHPRADHPTLSSLTNALLDSQPARAAAFVLWIAVTVELARR